MGLRGVLFDMNRSGAMISWEYFHLERPIPDLFRYIQDRDLCHQILEEYPDYPVVASWLRGKSNISYSLRSQPDFDCSEIAKLYGGGGHKNSAGFKLTI